MIIGTVRPLITDSESKKGNNQTYTSEHSNIGQIKSQEGVCRENGGYFGSRRGTQDVVLEW